MKIALRCEMERWNTMTETSSSVMCRVGVGMSLAFVLAVFPTPSLAQDEESEHVVRFSDPGRPGLLRLNLLHANATVVGYDGEEVIIVTAGGVALPAPPRPPVEPGRGPRRGPRRAPRISPGAGPSMVIGERNNVLTVRSRAFEEDISIRVPRGTSINFNGALGDLSVVGVSGRVTVNKQTGDVELRNISGAASVQTLAGDVFVSFSEVDPSQRMSFTTLSGTIVAEFPEGAEATVRVENMVGEISSEFEMIEMRPRRDRPGNELNVPRRKLLIGELNGGGSNVILLRNTSGDVILRKREP
jgi:hypothetical protein